jgi:DNA-binding CsgD family transcriptional regulator
MNEIEFNNRLQKITVKEMKVLQLLLQGKSNLRIATELYINISTVKSHISRICGKKKFGLASEENRGSSHEADCLTHL